MARPASFASMNAMRRPFDRRVPARYRLGCSSRANPTGQRAVSSCRDLAYTVPSCFHQRFPSISSRRRVPQDLKTWCCIFTWTRDSVPAASFNQSGGQGHACVLNSPPLPEHLRLASRGRRRNLARQSEAWQRCLGQRDAKPEPSLLPPA